MSKQVLEKNYGKLISGSARAKYNLSPGSKMAIRIEGDDHLSWSSWGLIPYNSKQIKDFEKLSCLEIDRIKTVTNKNSKRCIIPANGYFYWNESNKPYLFQYARNPHFAFAGICESWEIGTGKQIQTFAILMTASKGGIIKELPEAMPIAMNSQDSKTWLENDEIIVTDSPSFIIDPHYLISSPASEDVIDPMQDNPGLLKKGNTLSSGENFKLF